MKEKRFEIRLTESEYKQLKEKAEKAGISQAALLRKYINDQPVLDSELRSELRNLDVALSRIGNNINQIAHKWNESGSDMRDIAHLTEQMGEVYWRFKEVRDYCYTSYRSKQ